MWEGHLQYNYRPAKCAKPWDMKCALSFSYVHRAVVKLKQPLVTVEFIK